MANQHDPAAGGDTDLLEIDVQTESESVWVHVSGELDLATADQLREALDDILNGRGQVVLDLAELNFCGAEGLSAMLAAHQALDEQGRHLSIRGASGVTRRAILATGLDQVFDLS